VELVGMLCAALRPLEANVTGNEVDAVSVSFNVAPEANAPAGIVTVAVCVPRVTLAVPPPAGTLVEDVATVGGATGVAGGVDPPPPQATNPSPATENTTARRYRKALGPPWIWK
jgi:hypothetical protein